MQRDPIPKMQRAPRCDFGLKALVARGRISLQRTTQEVVASLERRDAPRCRAAAAAKDEMTKAIRRCERRRMVPHGDDLSSLGSGTSLRFFGGLSAEMKEGLRAVRCCQMLSEQSHVLSQ